MLTTTLKRVRPAQGKRANEWAADNVVYSSSSKLLDVNLEKLFQDQFAQDSVTEEERVELLALLPPNYAAEFQERGFIDLNLLKYDTNWRNGLRTYREDLGSGRLESWHVKEAADAMEERAQGNFDNWKEREFEEFWGQKQKLPENVQQANENVKQTNEMPENWPNSKLKASQVFYYGGLIIGDIWRFQKEFRVGVGNYECVTKEAKLVKCSPGKVGELVFTMPPGKYETSEVHLREDLVIEVQGPSGLGDAILSVYGLGFRMMVGFRDFHIIRNNQDIGSLWDVRQRLQFEMDMKDAEAALTGVPYRRTRTYKGKDCGKAARAGKVNNEKPPRNRHPFKTLESIPISEVQVPNVDAGLMGIVATGNIEDFLGAQTHQVAQQPQGAVKQAVVDVSAVDEDQALACDQERLNASYRGFKRASDEASMTEAVYIVDNVIHTRLALGGNWIVFVEGWFWEPFLTHDSGRGAQEREPTSLFSETFSEARKPSCGYDRAEIPVEGPIYKHYSLRGEPRLDFDGCLWRHVNEDTFRHEMSFPPSQHTEYYGMTGRESSAGLVAEFIRRANAAKTQVIYMSAETLRKPEGVKHFIRFRRNGISDVQSQISSLSSSARTLIVVDSLHVLATALALEIPTFLSSLLKPSTSLLATYHQDIPISRTGNPYLPQPLILLKYLCTTILQVYSLPQVLACKQARDRSIREPKFGLAELRDGIVVGMGSNDPSGVVIEMEYRRKSGRGIAERFYLNYSPSQGGREKDSDRIILLDDHPLYRPVNFGPELPDYLPTVNAPATFNLELTEKQRKDRDNVVLPYFDAQRDMSGGVGDGGRILYDMGEEDDFDEEEDEI
ncbi:MAG: hypothetical protein M1829_003807 [Trizodia sp. TS-e1964]|nr:MAG: hypothetical protein M1829_003807 [Trizodia sp. TS-e1964]